MATKLEETKGKFKVEGKVVGISNENAYREGFTEKDDKPYKSLAFFVQTSPDNQIRVELFGMEKDTVYLYSNKEKKSKPVNWDARNEKHGDFKLMGTTMYLEGEGEKKTKKIMVELEAIDYILEHIKDGDSVRVSGRIDFQQFEDSEGNKKESTKFQFQSISKLTGDKEIDFEAEDFKEVAQFEQTIIVTDKMVEEKKLLISANIVKYGEEIVPTTFVVNEENYPKLFANMKKRLGFGDVIKVYGLILNKTIKIEAPPEDTAVDSEDDWGGDDEIVADFDTQYITEFISELEVTSVDPKSYVQAQYKEEDFYSDGQDAFDGENFEDEDEIDEEDLPF